MKDPNCITRHHPYPCRQAAVAGRFYPRDAEQLHAEIVEYLAPGDSAPVRAIGCIVPHAGYMYSGHVAGAVFARIEIPRRCIVLCPNHTGVGRPLAIVGEGAWETPLGEIPIDVELAAALKQRLPALEEDSSAHRAEHAVEVELPFLQASQTNLTFVPIALGARRLEPLEELGLALADVIAGKGIAKNDDPILIIASSDMNHYESDAVTRVKDHQALERILSVDPLGLYDVVTQRSISMCGLSPAVAMLTAARKLGAKSAKLVKYATSGDISRDRNMVVGYAGIVVS
jgi:AmmeMemoRadiSam system protein B